MSLESLIEKVVKGAINGVRASSRRYAPKTHARLFQWHWAKKSEPEQCFYCCKPRWKWTDKDVCPRRAG